MSTDSCLVIFVFVCFVLAIIPNAEQRENINAYEEMLKKWEDEQDGK